MKRSVNRPIQSLLVSMLIAACSNGELPETSGKDVRRHVGEIALPPVDPCALALMPDGVIEADSRSGIDPTIVRHQQAVLGATDAVPRLERLGWAYVAKARANRDAGAYTLALQTAACIDSKAPNAPESWLLKGHALHNLHRFSEAELLARRLVERRGLWFDFALLGDTLLERGELDEAVDAYQALMDQRPGPQAYARVAHVRWLTGDLDGALEMMATAVVASSPRTPEPTAWLHVRLAMLLMQLDELRAAEAVLTEALTLQPAYPPALHAYGRLLLAQGKPNEAIVYLRNAVHKDPQPEHRWTLYEALVKAGKRDVANVQKAALMGRGAHEDRRTLALFLASHGAESDTALRLAAEELSLRADVFTLDVMAWALAAAGRYQQALHFIRQALAEGTKDARLFLHAGVIAARTGDGARALDYLAEAERYQQMLLPSERQRLSKEFAALQPRMSALVTG